MEVGKNIEVWMVRGRRCPCDCAENGALVYLSCPKCKKVVLVCDEIGNVFDNLKELLDSAPLVIWRSSKQTCPGCNQALLADFLPTLKDNLESIGLSNSDYEPADTICWDSIRRLADH